MKAHKFTKIGLSLFIILLILVGCNNPDSNKTQTPIVDQDTTQSQPDIIREDTAKPRSYTVEIKDMEFQPADLKVHAGDTVTWVNKDLVVHDVTQENKVWASAPLPSDSSFKKIITQSDAYYCIPSTNPIIILSLMPRNFAVAMPPCYFFFGHRNFQKHKSSIPLGLRCAVYR